MTDNILKPGNHTPIHLFRTNATYMCTASLYCDEHLMKTDLRKAEWRDSFHKAAEIHQWKIIAWVVLSNHYHALLRSPGDPEKSIDKFVASYHKFTAAKWNKEDDQIGRPVWWNYWDACIRSEHDYYNRLRYVFWNPVKHGLVQKPEDYRFSNYKEYLDQLQSVGYMGMDEVNDVPEF